MLWRTCQVHRVGRQISQPKRPTLGPGVQRRLDFSPPVRSLHPPHIGFPMGWMDSVDPRLYHVQVSTRSKVQKLVPTSPGRSMGRMLLQPLCSMQIILFAQKVQWLIQAMVPQPSGNTWTGITNQPLHTNSINAFGHIPRGGLASPPRKGNGAGIYVINVAFSIKLLGNFFTDGENEYLYQI